MFGGRLVFPIHNIGGELVAYGGINAEDGSYLYPKKFRPELELYNLSRVREDPQTDGLVIIQDPHKVWSQFENGCRDVVARMLPELSDQQEQLLAS